MIFLQGVCSFEPLSSRYKKQKTKKELRNAVEYRKQRVIFGSRDLEWNWGHLFLCKVSFGNDKIYCCRRMYNKDLTK